MRELAGARALVTGGAGTIGSTVVDQLLAAGASEIRILDNLVRGRCENLASALLDDRVALVQGDIRDRDLVHDLTRGVDLVFHQAAIRITQCAEEPRLALEVLVDGTFNVVEAAADQGVSKLIAASSASVYGLAEEFPTTERHHHHNNDTFYGAAKSFNEGMLRNFRAMTGIDYVLLRYFNVYGPRMDIHGLYTEVLIRWMERIADGERPLIFGSGEQTMDFVHTVDIARANLLAATAPVSEGVYNIASGTETSLLELAQALLQATGSTLDVEHGLSGPSTASRGGWRVPAPRSAISASSRRSGSSTGCAGSSSGGGASEMPSAPLETAERVNVMQPVFGAEELAAIAEVLASGWVTQGPKAAAFEAAFADHQRSRAAVAVSSCTAALHLAMVVIGVRRDGEVVVPSLSFIATANAVRYVGARPRFCDVDPISGNVTAATIEPMLSARRLRDGRSAAGQDQDRMACARRYWGDDAAAGSGTNSRGGSASPKWWAIAWAARWAACPSP